MFRLFLAWKKVLFFVLSSGFNPSECIAANASASATAEDENLIRESGPTAVDVIKLFLEEI